MTVSNQVCTVTEQGNGATTVWPYAFQIPYQDGGTVPAVTVYVTTLATSTVVTLSPSVYTITGIGNPSGGNVTYPLSGAPLSSLYALTIERTKAYTQPTAVSNVAFLPHVVEQVGDATVLLVQQLARNLSRTMQKAIGTDNWDALGKRIVNLANGVGAQDAATFGQVLAYAGSGSNPNTFNTRTELAASVVSAPVQFITIANCSANGDLGWCIMDRQATAHPRVPRISTQSADGAWWWVRPEVDGWNTRALGVKGDGVTDDTDAVQQCWNIFTNGVTGLGSGRLKFRGVSIINYPLGFNGSAAYSVEFVGFQGFPFADTATAFKWGGVRFAQSMVVLNGVNNSPFRGINFDTSAGNCVQAVHCSSSNIANLTTTISLAITAGANVTVVTSNIRQIVPGSVVPVGIADHAEFVYVKATSGNSFTADFRFDHAANAPVGGGEGSSGINFHDAKFTVGCSLSTTMTSGGIAAGVRTITLGKVDNLDVGSCIVVDTPKLKVMEFVYITAVDTGAKTVTGTFAQAHLSGCSVKIPNCGVLWGNRAASDTMQVSEGRCVNVLFAPAYNGGYGNGDTYTSQRFTPGGNVKNFNNTDVQNGSFFVGVSIEAASGRHYWSSTFGGCSEADFLYTPGGSSLVVAAYESEGEGSPRMLISQGGADGSVTFFGPNYQNHLPADNFITDFAANLQIFGGSLHNNDFDLRTPAFRCAGLQGSIGFVNPGGACVIGCYGYQWGPTTRLFFDGSGNCIDQGNYGVIQQGARIMAVNNYGEQGYTRNLLGGLNVTTASMSTDASTVSATINYIGAAVQTALSITLNFGVWSAAALTKELLLFSYPPKTLFTKAYADVTTRFQGVTGPVTFQLGSASGLADMLAAKDVSTAAVTLGLLDADMGTSMTRAAMVQGAFVPAWAAGGAVFAKQISASGNLSGLTAGVMKVFITTERYN